MRGSPPLPRIALVAASNLAYASEQLRRDLPRELRTSSTQSERGAMRTHAIAARAMNSTRAARGKKRI